MEKRNTKAEVLEILLNSGETPVSGERLAENLGISRNAVWKAVTAKIKISYAPSIGVTHLSQKEIQVIF